ncbi:hypothetical protein A4A49_65096, partial [Nicotiana attenuata]
MEDQKVLKAFIDDSIRGSIQDVKDSFSKEIAEMRELLKEVIVRQDHGPANTTLRHRPEFGRFYGANQEAWIFQAERYFDFYRIELDEQLTVASFYLDGEALEWYRWLFRNKQLVDWPHFADKVRIRFKQKGLESAEGRLAK